ncbi:hypothetical protein ES708_23103 [subsurface metagenome]
MKEHTVKILASIDKLRKLREDLPSLGSEIMIAGSLSMYPIKVQYKSDKESLLSYI